MLGNIDGEENYTEVVIGGGEVGLILGSLFAHDTMEIFKKK